MSDMPALYVWNPRLYMGDETRSTIKFTLTPFTGTNTLSADRSMWEGYWDIRDGGDIGDVLNY